MRRILTLAVPVAALLWAGAAGADPWKDESGKGRWRDRGEALGRGYEPPRDRKVKYRTADGCEVERKWKKGGYEEKVKCKGRRY